LEVGGVFPAIVGVAEVHVGLNGDADEGGDGVGQLLGERVGVGSGARGRLGGAQGHGEQSGDEEAGEDGASHEDLSRD
jgi:hypothetical protein